MPSQFLLDAWKPPCEDCTWEFVGEALIQELAAHPPILPSDVDWIHKLYFTTRDTEVRVAAIDAIKRLGLLAETYRREALYSLMGIHQLSDDSDVLVATSAAIKCLEGVYKNSDWFLDEWHQAYTQWKHLRPEHLQDLQEKGQLLSVRDFAFLFTEARTGHSDAVRLLGISAEEFPELRPLITPLLLELLREGSRDAKYYAVEACYQAYIYEALPILRTMKGAEVEHTVKVLEHLQARGYE